MKLFYSIDELASIIGKDQYDTAHMLKVEGVLMTYHGEPADLSRWTGGVSRRGNSIFVLQGYYDDPSPSSVLVLADSLPVSWITKIELSEAESGGLISEDESGEPESAGLTEDAARATMPSSGKTGPQVTSKVLLEAFRLHDKKWLDILARPKRDGKKYADALASPGKPGRARAGETNSALWWAGTFGRLLVENDILDKGQVKTRFKNAWPKWEDEMLVEIGEIQSH